MAQASINYEMFAPCEEGDHGDCASEAQLKREGPPTRCICDCHDWDKEG